MTIEHFYQGIRGFFTFEDFYRWLAAMYPDGHGVEVGAFAGRSAAFLAVEMHNQYELLVDKRNCPRLDLVDNAYPGGVTEVSLVLKAVHHVIGDLWEEDSGGAAGLYKDNTLDFVFIDADHSYEGVRRDVDAWLPKVKVGGVIAGHDFRNGFGFGVVDAVLESFDRVEIWKGSLCTGDGVRDWSDDPAACNYLPVWCARVTEKTERKVVPWRR